MSLRHRTAAFLKLLFRRDRVEAELDAEVRGVLPDHRRPLRRARCAGAGGAPPGSPEVQSSGTGKRRGPGCPHGRSPFRVGAGCEVCVAQRSQSSGLRRGDRPHAGSRHRRQHHHFFHGQPVRPAPASRRRPRHAHELSTPRTTASNAAIAFTWPLFADVREQAKSFSGIAAYYELVPASFSGSGEPERVWGQAATANFFDVAAARHDAGPRLHPRRGEPSRRGSRPPPVAAPLRRRSRHRGQNRSRFPAGRSPWSA